MHITWASEPLTVNGDRATWTGELGDLQDFEVRFERGFLGQLWAGIRDFLGKPVIRL